MENNDWNNQANGEQINPVPAPPAAYENPNAEASVAEAPAEPQFAPQPIAPQYAPQPNCWQGYPVYNNPQQVVPQPIYTSAPAPVSAQPYQPKVHAVAPVNPAVPTKKSKKGMAAFILAVAFVLVLAIGAGIGYIMGADFQRIIGQAGTQSNSVPKVELVPKPENGQEYTVESIYNVAKESVVRIMAYSESVGKYSMSSGVIYSEDGYIVTNDHIYENLPGATFVVQTNDGRRFEGKFVAGDNRSDLAVIKIEAENLKPAVFGDSDQLAVGETVVTIGHPDGSENPVATSGIVSAANVWVPGSTTYSTRLIQTDADINSGSSGGALVNAYGQVVGITSSKIIAIDTDSVNYSIPTNVMKRVVDSLIANGYVTGRAKLGITYYELGSLEAFASGHPAGIYIESVEEGSKLASKGLESGDIITHVNGKEITSSGVMLSVLENLPVGTEVTLTVYRNGSPEITIVTELEEYIGTSSYQPVK